MKILLPASPTAAALALPGLAEARPVTFEATLKNYGGNGAYVVLYVTDAAGKYRGTLWMAGGKAKYYRHLSDWQRASGGAAGEIDGITGASIGSGKTLKISLDLADALIDAGYQRACRHGRRGRRGQSLRGRRAARHEGLGRPSRRQGLREILQRHVLREDGHAPPSPFAPRTGLRAGCSPSRP